MTSAEIHQLAVRAMRDIIIACNRYRIWVDNVETPMSPKEITGFKVARRFSLQLLEADHDLWCLFRLFLQDRPHIVWEYGVCSLRPYCHLCAKTHRPTKVCRAQYPKVIRLEEIRTAKNEIFQYLFSQLELPK